MKKIPNMSSEQNAKLIPEGTILLGYRGSIAHGMYRDPLQNTDAIDDRDLMGVCVPPVANYFGLSEWGRRGTQDRIIDQWDVVVYEVRKMARLLLNCNPNVLSLLWLPENMYVIRTPHGNRLIENRDLFVSKKAYHAFNGYAYSQLKQLERPATGQAYNGAKRRAQFDALGYDAKHAAHLIRLLRMGIEFLNEGKLHVHREDAPQLMDIKLGRWQKDQVLAESKRLFRRAEDAYDRSTLPQEPDRHAIDALVVSIVHDVQAEREPLGVIKG